MSRHLLKFAEYAAARLAHDEAKAAATAAEETKQRLERELVDVMIDEGVKSFTVTGGLTVGMRKRFDCAVNKDNNDQVERWLVEAYGDVKPFQKLVLYKPAVVAHLKKLAEDEKLDETAIPAFLNLRTTPGVSVRGWKGMSDDE